MKNRCEPGNDPRREPVISKFNRVIRLSCVLLILFVLLSARGQAQRQKSKSLEPVPEPAVPALLAAFDRYDVVAMPAGHGIKDLDDLILTLVRNPAFSKKVNDIEIECGNSLYQDVLDRYTTGADVSFRDVQKVWRNTTQPSCGLCAFYEQIIPLVRAINRKLPPGKGIRVLGGDPPFDWDQIKSSQDMQKALQSVHRDTNIAAVMEKEVLSKHRKALMLMGAFHLVHGTGASAVSLYERRYPNVTLVISGLGTFDTNLPDLSSSAFAAWPIPALARVRGTWLGKLGLDKFLPPPTLIDQDCNVHNEFPRSLQKPAEELFDAILYLGPQDLMLWEKTPADVVVDADYMKERRRRETLPGSTVPAAQAPDGFDRQIFQQAENPLFAIDTKLPNQTDIEEAVQDCHERKRQSGPTK